MSKEKGKIVHRFRTASEMAAGMEPGQPLGIICPKCGCKQVRVDTTRRVVAGVVRYRECRVCGTRWRTDEH